MSKLIIIKFSESLPSENRGNTRTAKTKTTKKITNKTKTTKKT